MTAGPAPLADVDKAALVAALVEQLTEAVDSSAARAKATAASAVHAESKAEDSKDTRAIEESYLARGQAERVAALEHDRAMFRSLRCLDFTDGRPIAATALIETEDEDGGTRTVFLAPCGGGRSVRIAGREIHLATPASPLGRALLGAEEGDEFVLRVKRGSRTYEIVEVA